MIDDQAFGQQRLLTVGNACQLLHIIGLGSTRLRSEQTFEAEGRRRRFWACYLTHCHLGENTQPFDPVVMKKLALPWREEDFNSKTPTGTQAYLEEIEASNGGIFEELVRVLTIWAKIVSLVRSRPSNSAERVSAIYALDEELRRWWSRLPSGLKIDTSGPLAVVQELVPNVLLLDVFFHQSLCVLHSSLVPIFCWSKGEEASPTALQVSAQVAYDHACEVSNLIESVLNGYERLSAIPSFVTYAAYCGCKSLTYNWPSCLNVEVTVYNGVQAQYRFRS
jgi:hypothetical protein